jgi:hypothetical protein
MQNGRKYRRYNLNKCAAIYPHLFRHTFATQLLQDGVSVQSVAALLGHSKTSMTEKRYSHWIKGRQENLELEVKKSWTNLGSAHQEQKPKPNRVLVIPKQKQTVQRGSGVARFSATER